MSEEEVSEVEEHRHHEVEEESPWPAIMGLSTAALIAGLLVLLKGISLLLGLGLVGFFLCALLVFLVREVRIWPLVIEGFYGRLRKTAIPAEPERVSGVGFPTVVVLFTEAALFGSAFGVYFAVRAGFPVWPPPGSPHFNDVIPRIQTAMLLVSSLMVEWALWSAKHDRKRGILAGIVGTALLGTGFMALKLGLEWPHLILEEGFTPASGFYGSSFYILTGAHGAHVVGGVVALVVAAGRAKRGQFTSESHGYLEACGMYWHFVHLVWLMLFAFIWEGGLLFR